MLYPQSSSTRQMLDLSGFWQIQFDPAETGGFESGFDGGEIIAVPASWNDQFNERRDYLGTAWYQTTFALPWGWRGQRIFVRFNSVNYLAEVWLNGVQAGRARRRASALRLRDHRPRQRRRQRAGRARQRRTRAGSRAAGQLVGEPGVSFGRVDYPRRQFRLLPLLRHSAPGADLHAAAGRDHRRDGHDRDRRRRTGSSPSRPSTKAATIC